MNTIFRRSSMAGAGAVMLALALLLPAAANAQEGQADEKDLTVSSTQVITGTMTIDCSTFTEADRERAIRENKNLCGALDATGQGGFKLSAASDPISARGSTVSDCGVASIYVDRWSGNQLRISYGLHSTQGVIITRSVTATWGPVPTGSNFDFGAVGQTSYSNSLIRAGLPSNAKAGATLRGTVSTAGWGFVCWVVADDPVHKL